jgi:hypothetical protein
VHVDLQDGQAVISATLTYRRQEPKAVVAIFTPSLENGRLFWTLQSATVNGEPASQQLIDQINAALGSAWRNYFRKHGPAGRITGITITESDVTVTYTAR